MRFQAGRVVAVLALAAVGAGLLAFGMPVHGAVAETGGHVHGDASSISRSTALYRAPAVQLVRDDGRRVSLQQEMDDGRPVILNFIFTSCSSICPLASQTFAEFQRKLGAESASVHIMSISIDPEEDTPARLAEYARKYGAGPQWQHYTGSLTASIAAQRAFDVFRGDKMSHTPVTLMRAAPGKPWLRIEGFVTPDDLLQDYRALLAAK
jgi:protein SCO1